MEKEQKCQKCGRIIKKNEDRYADVNKYDVIFYICEECAWYLK